MQRFLGIRIRWCLLGAKTKIFMTNDFLTIGALKKKSVLLVCVCVCVFFSFFGFADACFENKTRHRLQRESRGNFGVVYEWVVVLQVG